MRRLLVFLPTLLACSSSTPPNSTPTDGGTTQADASSSANKISVSMELSVPPGEELHQCQLVRVPTDVDIDVVALSHEYSTGSHHFLAFTTDLSSIPPELSGQYDCVRGNEPIMQHARGIMYGAQSPKGEFPFPAGVGYRVKAGQILMLQAHYLNPSSAAIDAKASMSFTKASSPDQVNTQAGFLIHYDPFIYLPAQGKATSSVRCKVPEAVTLITAFTHYHQRGTGMRVYIDPSRASPSAAPFFETNDWEHPANFVGPKEVAAGSEFRVQCDYTNTDGKEVFQGPNAATSEMCVFAALYYPSRNHDFDSCTSLSVVGSGTETCQTLSTCVQACPAADAPAFTNGGVDVGPCWERCVAKGCDGATDALLPLVTCVSRQCETQCGGGGTGCTACALEKCGPEASACTAQACK
jgi:hypothetical protein